MTLYGILKDRTPPLSTTATLRDARETILRNRTAAVIVEGGKPVGIITRRDHIQLILKGIKLEDNALIHARSDIIRVRIDRSLEHALMVMADYNVKRVVVVDEKGCYVGLISYDAIIEVLENKTSATDYRVSELVAEKNALFLPPYQTLGYAAGAMMGGHVPVTIVIDENKKPLGVVTESHILEAEETPSMLALTLDKVMHKGVITVDAMESIQTAVEKMHTYNVHTIIVIDQEGHALGALNGGEIVRKLHTPLYPSFEAKMNMLKETMERIPYAVIDVNIEGGLIYILWANRFAYRFFPTLSVDTELKESLPGELGEMLSSMIGKEQNITKHVLSYGGNVYECTLFYRTENRWQILINDISELSLLQNEIHRAQQNVKAERQKAYEALKNSSAILYTVLNSVEALIYVIDIETYEVIFANKKAHRLFGHVEGMKCYAVFQKNEQTPCSFCPLGEYKRSGLAHEGLYYEWENHNSLTDRDYAFHERIVRWIDGRLVKIQVGLDITEQKVMEETLQRLNEALEERVHDEIEKNRAKELLIAKQSRLAAMGEMINAIAHQWRQPLNSLAILMQDLPDAYSYGELDEKYLDKAVHKGMATVLYMSKTIDDFRNFFKPDKQPRYFSVTEASQTVLGLVGDQLKAHGIEIITNFQTHETVLGYVNEFEQVLLNIINNARDVCDERKVAHKQITITTFQHETEVCVSVEDSAGGMKHEILERVFEPYFTTKETNKGTGLGLYLAKMIIEDNMKGHIEAKNGEHGAIFTISLPLQ